MWGLDLKLDAALLCSSDAEAPILRRSCKASRNQEIELWAEIPALEL